MVVIKATFNAHFPRKVLIVVKESFMEFSLYRVFRLGLCACQLQFFQYIAPL